MTGARVRAPVGRVLRGALAGQGRCLLGREIVVDDLAEGEVAIELEMDAAEHLAHLDQIRQRIGAVLPKASSASRSGRRTPTSSSVVDVICITSGAASSTIDGISFRLNQVGSRRRSSASAGPATSDGPG